MSEENTGLTSPYGLADKLITRGPISKDKPFRTDENGFEVPNRIFDNTESKEEEPSNEEPKKEELDIEKANELYDALHNILDHPIDPKDTMTLMPKEFLAQTPIPVEMEKLAFPDVDKVDPPAEEGAKLTQTAKWSSTHWHQQEEQPSITGSSLYPDKSYGSSTVKSVASLAEHTKEELKETIQEKKQKQLESVSDPGLLYQRFDDTFTKLFEELENNDVLSLGQKSALLMKCAMMSKNILKERFDVTI